MNGGSQATRWWLIRHAPIAEPYRGRIVGRTDVEIARPVDVAALRQGLPERPEWVVSPALRARQTAEALGARTWRVVPELAEQDFGRWEGESWTELIDRDPEAARFQEAYDHIRPPGGEALLEVQRRCWSALEALAADPPAPDVVVVAHSGPIRCLVAKILEIPLGVVARLSIDYLSLTRIDGGPDFWQVRAVNAACLAAVSVLEPDRSRHLGTRCNSVTVPPL